MKAPRFGPMLLAAALFCCLLFLPERYWARLLPADLLAKAAPSGDLGRFKNVLLQDGAYTQGNYLPMYGSSTIGIFGNYHPVNVFPEQQGDPVPFLVGQSACSSIIHLLNFSAVQGALDHKKLVFMLDPSDFMNPKGMSDQRFGQLYNPLQGYSFLFNSDLSPEDRQREAGRLLQYSVIKKDPLLLTELKGMADSDFEHRLMGILMRPEAYLRMKILEKQDLLQAWRFDKTLKPYQRPTLPANHSWNELLTQAEKTGKQQSGSNTYGFLDSVYKNNIAPSLNKEKNSWKPGSYLQSVEYGDMQAILDILKKEQAEPIFILLPRKGAWSDYIGFNEEYREQLYSKIKGLVTAEGFPVLDYSDYAYDPYFMRDPNHLGWTGWVHVDKDLQNYYEKAGRAG
ncbi:D-alanyl-lipoteichoic acid biosynthesis protein DltD [Paenibacillus filicis]|uniref:Protein DltD n=1 Tax=Paenibacillus gyeongsangnamensis TaxID=3388067 RepID=A0ABT4Q849_9BACL|nr:D-alanyl-lipoteichoic acid biosynthesis protein DltD [Paenibacillus filicis]MCZ8513053.1 D-alanyl-lipoteichoic acid biosynthesis protein DltD [Paenibacillus filicis]